MIWIRVGDRYRQVHPYVFVDFLDEYPNVGWYQFVQTERNRVLLKATPAPAVPSAWTNFAKSFIAASTILVLRA